MSSLSAAQIQQIFRQLGLRFFERGWLSSNNVLFDAAGDRPAAVLDTGYASHAEQTLSLLEEALGGSPLGLIVNTHLHSDHCGGNAALQARWRPRTLVPEACRAAAEAWDQEQLSFVATDQRCERFTVDGALKAGDSIELGRASWQVHAAPGHDPTALMLFQPEARVLISGDALWEKRLAIIFPELTGDTGFESCLATLQAIEDLAPRVVIPGHGRAFSDVASALSASRSRLEAFRRDPQRHARHAIRALVMFHMYEIRTCSHAELTDWLYRTPITASAPCCGEGWAEAAIEGLVQDGILLSRDDRLQVIAE